MRFIKFLFFLLLCVVSGACENHPFTPTPPVPVFGNFLLAVAASHPSDVPSSDASVGKALNLPSFDAGGIRLTQTRQALSQISFKPDQGPQTEIQFPETFVAELIKDGRVADLEFPNFGIATIPFGTYHSVEMKFDPLSSAEIPSELLQDPVVSQFLINRNLIVQGSFTLLGQEIPLIILSEQNASIRVSSPNAFTVSSTQVNYFFIAFRIDDWFQGLLPLLGELTLADLTNGTLVISNDHPNPVVRQILALFQQNVDDSLRLAPSTDPIFQESDVDGSSSSVPF